MGTKVVTLSFSRLWRSVTERDMSHIYPDAETLVENERVDARFRSPFNRLAALVVSCVGLALFIATLKEARRQISTASARFTGT